jgi:hypothetical protein
MTQTPPRSRFRRILRRVSQLMAFLGYTIVGLFISLYIVGYWAGGLSIRETTLQLDGMSPREVREGLRQVFFRPQLPEPTPPKPAPTGPLPQGEPFAGKPATERDRLWWQDVEYLAENVNCLHVTAGRYLAPEQFQADCEKLKSQVSLWTDQRIACEISRVLAQLGDAHTQVNTQPTHFPFRRVPFQVRKFSDGFFITRTTPEQTALYGARITHVGTHSIETVATKLKPYFSAENRFTDIVNVQTGLQYPDFLQAAGLIDTAEKLPLTLVDASGKPQTVEVPISHTVRTPPTNTVVALGNLPKYLQDADQSYWYCRLPERHTMYLKYNNCQGHADFAKLTAELWQDVDANRTDRIIVDLRANGGGDSSVFKPLLKGITARGFDRYGKLFVLTDRGTFSSAFLNTLDLLKLHAIHVGETPSQKLNYGGNIRNFPLPNSKIRISYPTQDSSHWPEVDIRTVEPQFEILPSSQDHFSGRDPVLEFALTHGR